MPTQKIELHGILKHANVCRVLCRNDILAHEFYTIARVCSENLPPATITTLHHETSIHLKRADKGKAVNAPSRTWRRVNVMVRKGLLQTRRDGPNVFVEPTLTGWKFFILTLAEMERPVRDMTIFDSPKKLLWRTHKRKFGPKEKKARKAFSIVKAAKPIGLSIWQRCGVASMPRFQRLKPQRARPSIEPKSSPPDSTSSPSEPISPP